MRPPPKPVWVPEKSGYVLAIAKILHRRFGRVTLEPLKARPDAEVLAFLTALPGVGLKTAKCVMMFNMDREVLPVDAHVARVAGRSGSDVDAPLNEQFRLTEAFCGHTIHCLVEP